MRKTKQGMTMQPQTDGQSAQISAQTERAIHAFVVAAVSRLTDAPMDQALKWEADSRWEAGTDGHFREQTKRRWFWLLSDDWLRSLTEYDACVKLLRRDPVVGPHLYHLVGTYRSAHRLEADAILLTLIDAMLDDEGNLAFTDERFNCEWGKLVDFFCADQIGFRIVAPIPNLVLPTFPLRLNHEIVLDRLTEDEVTRCLQVGVLRPMSPRFPLIDAGVAVGVRRTMFLPKIIQTGNESHEPSGIGDEGRFGNRPILQDSLVIDDVLSALRLFKHTQIHASGHASWSESFWLEGGTSYRVLQQWPYGGQFELSEGEVPEFLELWHLLEEGGTRFGFSIRRFNLAFDRGLSDDRIVDLVIAAESLFLSDLGIQDRGELRFRFALRAAKFIEHPVYGEREVYRFMRRAYDARSAIVHGGSPGDTRQPDNQSAGLPTFIDAIEEFVRLGIRKGLSMKHDGGKLRQAEYWEDLLLSKPN